MGICNYNECKLKYRELISLCNYCNKNYCSKHRIPESHLCEELNFIKENSKKLLVNELLNSKVVSKKLNII